eukprot:scaffold135140_cov31-Tisochrysis_lutea.AAC.1
MECQATRCGRDKLNLHGDFSLGELSTILSSAFRRVWHATFSMESVLLGRISRGKLPRPGSKTEYGSLSRANSRANSSVDIAGAAGQSASNNGTALLGRGPSRGRLP